MSKKTILAAVIAAATAISASAADAGEARLLRFPATDGNNIVFSYAGDLWTVGIGGGEAKRLTTHIGYEMFARYSPDGKTIAFTGEYDGNREVYLIPSQGGEPVRLTYTSTNERDELGDRMGPNNIVMAWTNDGKSVIFRNRISEGFDGMLWSVPVDGTMPTRLPLPEGGFCSWSPDGKKLAYNRVMREFRTWKYYRGGMADDIWVWDGKSVTDITPGCDAQDIFPMWVGDEIYFASDRDMTMNIFVYNTKTKKTEKVTDFKDYDVKFPSTNGKLIVFEQAGWIWKLDPATKKAEKVTVTINSDNVYARPERMNVGRKLTSFGVSPDGSRLAVTARGEVFDISADKGVSRNISRTPGAHERNASWSPDGKTIAYISDRTGETEIWLQDAEDETKAPVQLTKGSDTYIRDFQWSPDGKKILYTDRKNRLVEVDPATAATKVVMTTPEGELRRVNWSADGKWITYTKPASNEMNVVYVYNLTTGKEYPVTEKWYNSSSPVFSTDGKYLIFTSDRDLNPIYSNVEWNYAYNNMSAIYLAILAKDGASPFILKDGMKAGKSAGPGRMGPDGMPGGPGPGGVQGPGGKPASGSRPEADMQQGPGGRPGPGGMHGPEGRPGEKADEIQEVRFDADGIVDRIVRVPVRSGGWGSMFCDGKKLWYPSGRGTNVFDFASQSDEQCCEGSISYRVGDKKAILMKGRREVSVVDFPSGKVHADGTVDTSNLYAIVDYPQEWAQIFDEAWRAYRDGFYLENMHGRDWKAVKAKYAVLLPYVKTRLDLNYVIGEMISELACGHAYVTVGDYDKPERIQMGLLGAEISRDKSGFFKIDRILEGAPYSDKLRSPLAEPGLGVAAGNYITAIDGVSTAGVKNIYSMLIGKAGVMTELTVNTKAAAGGKKVVVKPISDEYPLYHYEWVQNNIRTVDKLSNGKVGYIYIPDMGAEGLNEFVRYWYPQLDKEALIIDDRGNGGGNVSPMILERLQRQVYRMTMSRTSSMTGTTPDGTHTGPKVLLVNKYSASDGDLFPWSFKATGIGTVVGTRSWGGIIGISGSLPYMDDTDIRVPFFTNYDAKTGKWIVENHGVDPDILLDNDPVKEYAGTDQQLEEAVKVALEQIKDRKPLPGVPEPRTFKDLGLPDIK